MGAPFLEFVRVGKTDLVQEPKTKRPDRSPGPPIFVALGDSFTEGVGDANPGYPNGVRGWADRVAKHLAKQDPEWRYVNLAIRSKRLHQIVAEQLPAALDLRPSLVSFFAGGNDLLDVGTDPRRVLRQYEESINKIMATGAQVIMFTSYDLRITRLLEPFRPRNNLFNERIRAIARETGATLIDHQTLESYANPRLWSPDRIHMSKAGHKLMAATVLDALGVPWGFDLEDLDPYESQGRWEEWVETSRFWKDHVLPLIGRKLRRVTLGDTMAPKWPEPVRPADGLRKLEGRRRKRRAKQRVS